MLAFIGFVMAAQTTGKNPIAALQEHLAECVFLGGGSVAARVGSRRAWTCAEVC